jgi:hypothetical protein
MNIFQKMWVALVEWIGTIHWKPKNLLTEEDTAQLRELLTKDYYILLSHRNNHLSTYMISFANLFVNGKLSYWSHAFMNLEDEVKNDNDFIFAEAIGSGVITSHFKDVVDVNGLVLLKPKHLTIDKWTAILDTAKENMGRPYDNLFNLKSDKELSCVELVRDCLQADPNYATNFANFERMIAKYKNLTPQMYYDCPDFEVVWELRK